MGVSRKDHWEHVYQTRAPNELSWYQPVPERSMAFIRKTNVSVNAPIIDIGGGTSTLVDLLLNSDYSDITVLDISAMAIEASRKRVGDRAAQVRWIESDILDFEPSRRYYVWHDRAVFHFQVESGDISRYLDIMYSALAPMGYFALSTFGPEGPVRCSNLPTKRYSIEELTKLLDGRVDLVAFELEDHDTPSGVQQQFLYSLWRAKQ